MVKKRPFSLVKRVDNILVKVELTDLDGNQLTIDDIICLYSRKISILFTQEELLNVLSKEVFMQQFTHRNVQEKELKDCDKTEKEIKKMSRKPRCSDVSKSLGAGTEVRDLRSPKNTINYDTLLSKLEVLVKTKWDEWEEKEAKRSIRGMKPY